MYCEDCFTSQLKKYSQAYCVEHIDLAFDTCKSISLKKKDSWKRSEKKS